MASLIAGLLLFLGVHSISIAAPAWRDAAVTRMGRPLWQGAYSVVAVFGLVLVFMGYAAARGEAAVLYQLPRWTQWLTMLLMLPVFPLLFAAYLPGRISRAAKHPMLAATKMWAFAHLLANGTLADVVLFGGVLAWAVADRISLKRRVPRTTPGFPASSWNDLIAVAVGIGIYVLVLGGGHRWLTGMPLVLP